MVPVGQIFNRRFSFLNFPMNRTEEAPRREKQGPERWDSNGGSIFGGK